MQLEQRLGRPFIIENQPGAGGTTGAGFAARANPDGYTLLMAPSPTMAVAITIYKNLAYDPVADFVPLALIAQTPFVLIVNPALPVHSVAELIALAKEKPGQLSFGSAGAGTPHHLYAELFKSMTGIEMGHVPYRGSLPLLNDVVAGHIPLAFIDFGPSIGMLRAGQVRPLGISTKTRLAQFPDIPPIAEAGVPGFDAASWQMIVAPARTPRPIVDKLHARAHGGGGAAGVQEPDHQRRDAAHGQSFGRRIAGLRQVGNRALGRGGAPGWPRRNRIARAFIALRPHRSGTRTLTTSMSCGLVTRSVTYSSIRISLASRPFSSR